MDLLSLINKKFLSRSLNASLDCALNARKAVIGDYEQQKPILSSSLTSTPYNCYFFTTKHFFMSLGRLPDKKKVYFQALAKLPRFTTWVTLYSFSNMLRYSEYIDQDQNIRVAPLFQDGIFRTIPQQFLSLKSYPGNICDKCHVCSQAAISQASCVGKSAQEHLRKPR